LPWDTPGAVRRFLHRHRPCAGVLMETEIWPALLHAARTAGVPLLLANARLSPKSLAGQQRLPSLMRPAMGALTAAFAQTEADAQRLHDAGVSAVEVCGNLKFDMAPETALLARGRAWRAALGRAVVLAASTREGEEGALLACWQQALAGVDTARRPLLLVVPRHPQRFDEVAQLVRSSGLVLERRSGWTGGDGPPPGAEAADVWLGDSIGELPLYYACADLALLGGSYGGFGGQNLIESAACGCPLLIGPSTFNFADAAERAIEAGAAQRVPDLAAAMAAALELLDDRRTLRARAEACVRFAIAHRGAARRTAAAIVRHLPPSSATGALSRLTAPDQRASIDPP
jgi:3-deoxy-D-manno-octulosonic-acid transferase